MTTRFIWDELKKLVALDDQINTTKKEMATAQDEYAQKTTYITKRAAQADSLKSRAKEMHKEIDCLTLNVTEAQAEFERKNAMLGTLTHAKEYNALETELAGLERRITGMQKKIVTLRDQHDTAELEYADMADALVADEAKVADIKAHTNEIVGKCASRIAELELLWKEQFAKVPPALSATYAQLRARVPNPVVPVVSSSCSACFEGLLHQDSTALTEKTVIRCRSCYRFLFLPETPVDQAEQRAQ